MWNAYIIKQERFKINDLNFHLKNVRKKKSTWKSKKIEVKEIIKLRAEISELENRWPDNKAAF